MIAVFNALYEISIGALWLIGAVIIARLILRRAPKWTRLILWALVAVRLVMPFTPESPFGLIPSAVTQESPVAEGGAPVGEPTAVPDVQAVTGEAETMPTPAVSAPAVNGGAQSEAPTHVKQAPDARGIAVCVWGAGVMAMLAYLALSYRRLRRAVADAVYEGDGVWRTDGTDSAFVLGVIKPRIYLSYRIDGESAAHVIRHEKAHIKRADHILKPVAFMLLAAYWFHPAVWAAYLLFCRDIELACDERVVRTLSDGQIRAYSHALVSCSTRGVAVACPIAFGEVGVRGRVKNVLSYKKPTVWILAAALVISAVVGACFLTSRNAPSQGEGEAESEAGSAVFAGESEPLTVNIGRTACENEKCGDAEKDDLLLSFPADSEEGAALLDFLSFFRYEEEAPAGTDEERSVYSFFVEYADGSVISCTLGYYKTDEQSYAVHFTDGVLQSAGYDTWRKALTEALQDAQACESVAALLAAEGSSLRLNYAPASGIASTPYVDNAAAGYAEPFILIKTDTEPEIDGYTINLVPGIEQIEEENARTDVRLIPGDKPYVSLTVRDPADPLLRYYISVRLPELVSEGGVCRAAYPDELCADVLGLMMTYLEEVAPEYSTTPIDITKALDYDWTGHVFPQGDGAQITGIEYVYDNGGATGVSAIDYVRVDVRECEDVPGGWADERFELARRWLTTMVRGDVYTGEDTSLYRVIATYADGSVIEATPYYAQIDGVRYAVEYKEGLLPGRSMISDRSWVRNTQRSQMEAQEVKTADISHIEAVLCASDSLWTLYGADGVVGESRCIANPPSLSDIYFEPIGAPDVMADGTTLVVRSAGGDASVILRAGKQRYLEYTADGRSEWYVITYILAPSVSSVSPGADMIEQYKADLYTRVVFGAGYESPQALAAAYGDAFLQHYLSYPYEGFEQYSGGEVIRSEAVMSPSGEYAVELELALKPVRVFDASEGSALYLQGELGTGEWEGMRLCSRTVNITRGADGLWYIA